MFDWEKEIKTGKGGVFFFISGRLGFWAWGGHWAKVVINGLEWVYRITKGPFGFISNEHKDQICSF